MNELTKAVLPRLSTITSGFIKSSIHSLSSVPICCVIPEALALVRFTESLCALSAILSLASSHLEGSIWSQCGVQLCF